MSSADPSSAVVEPVLVDRCLLRLKAGSIRSLSAGADVSWSIQASSWNSCQMKEAALVNLSPSSFCGMSSTTIVTMSVAVRGPVPSGMVQVYTPPAPIGVAGVPSSVLVMKRSPVGSTSERLALRYWTALSNCAVTVWLIVWPMVAVCTAGSLVNSTAAT